MHRYRECITQALQVEAEHHKRGLMTQQETIHRLQNEREISIKLEEALRMELSTTRDAMEKVRPHNFKYAAQKTCTYQLSMFSVFCDSSYRK